MEEARIMLRRNIETRIARKASRFTRGRTDIGRTE